MFTVDFLLQSDSTLTVFWPWLVLFGCGVGFLTGLFGVGGGFLLTPCLNILFGIPFPNAVASSLGLFVCTGSQSAWQHWRAGNVDIRLGAIMATSAMGGSLLGKHLMKLLEESARTITIHGTEHPLLGLLMKVLFLVLMIAVMSTMLAETRKKPSAPSGDGDDEGAAAPAHDEEASTGIARRLQQWHLPPVLAFEQAKIASLSLWVPLGLSFGVGIMTGLMGVGGGFVLFPLLVYVIGAPTTVAVGTGAFQIVFATAAGTAVYWYAGQVWWSLVGLLLVGSLLGVQLGVRASTRFGGRKIRKYFAFVILLGIAVIAFDLGRLFLFPGDGAVAD